MSATTYTILQSLVNGLAVGGIYCLVSVGLTMIVGVMKMVNFAQGECLTIGMYLTFVLQQLTGWDPLILLIPVAVIMFFFGGGLFELVIKRTMTRENSTFTVVTMGLAYVISTVLLLVFTGIPKSVTSALNARTLTIGDLSVAMPRVAAILVMLVCVIALYLFLQKTDVGRAMRATAENKETCQMLGINTNRIARLAFSLGIMFAGIAGVLLTPTYYLYPSTGGSFKVLAMVCVVIGGLGSVGGAVLGGMLIGILESFVGTFVSVDIAPGTMFVLLVIVLIFLPNGLFGKGDRVA